MSKQRFSGEYTADWSDVARAVKDAADWRCVRCQHPHNPTVGRTLTVHHLNGRKNDNRWWNTVALCQACHLRIQGRVNLDRPWVMLPHSAWFRPYVAGFYASKYLGIDLTRAEVMARLDELLGLERAALVLPDGVGL